jgi:hypothetical protein
MVTNHYYEVTVKSHTFLDEDDLIELRNLVADFFETSVEDSEKVEVEHVDSEYL